MWCVIEEMYRRDEARQGYDLYRIEQVGWRFAVGRTLERGISPFKLLTPIYNKKRKKEIRVWVCVCAEMNRK